ncbi:MAG: hypothetical protein K2M55_03575 [Muribaculaceae bacterium]|nr:hypothetical protein [Muribaculaceae bacterium]
MKKLSLILAASAVFAGAPSAWALDAGYVPDDVSDLSATWNFATQSFDISMTAPSRSVCDDFWSTSYGALESIDRIVVYEYTGYGQQPVELYTFTDPAVGAPLTCSVSTLAAGKSYMFEVIVYADGEESEGRYVYEALAGGYPAAIATPTVTTTDGGMPITVSFTAPSVYKGTDYPLDGLSSIKLYGVSSSYWDPDVVLSELTNPEPGKAYEMTVNDPSVQGKQNWYLVASNTLGDSEKTEFSIFVGMDTPGAVGSLKAVEQTDGSVLVSWEAPTKGANNGQFSTDGLTYDVYLRTPGSWGDDSSLLESGLTATSYLYAPGVQTEIKEVAFAVTPSNAQGAGTISITPKMFIGPAYSLPLTETFDTEAAGGYGVEPDYRWASSTTITESYPPTWRYSNYVYAGSTQVTPESGNGGLAYLSTYDYTPAGDFSLTSAKIALDGAPAVSLSFLTYEGAAPAGTSVTAEVSFDMGATFVPAAEFKFAAGNTGWTKVSGDAVAPAGAEYAILRLSAHTIAGAAATFVIDQIMAQAGDAPVVVYPASVSDFTAVLADDEESILVSMVAPDKTHPTLGEVNGEPLTSITKIVLGRQIGYGSDYATVHEFVNPAPGAHLEYLDTDLAQGGEYRYRALVYVGANSDYGDYTETPVTVGQIPAEVTDFTATSSRGAAPVVLTFTAPAVDFQGKALKTVKAITVTRYDSETFVWNVIAELTEGLEPGKTETVQDATVRSGEVYEYRVSVTGTAGSSYGVTRSVYVGVDEPMPPTDIRASLGADGKVVVAWTAPEGGLNGGYIDVGALTYDVYRGNGYSDYSASLLARGVKECSYTDPTVFTDEENVRYFVKANNGGLAGISASSGLVLVGNPSALPYVENFDRVVDGYIEPEHGAWTTSSNEPTSVWAYAELGYLINEGQVQPVNGGAGLAYAYYGPYNSVERYDYLTSGRIAVDGKAELTLEFYYYGVPFYETSLDAQVSFDGGEFESVKYIYFWELQKEGWEKVSVKFPVKEGASTMQLRMVAHKGAYSCSAIIDNILITDEAGAVDTVLAADATVYAEGNAIVVEAAAEQQVVIADLGGRVLYTGTGALRRTVAPGVYMVNVAGRTVKLAVK